MSEQTQNNSQPEIPANKLNGYMVGGMVVRKTKFAPKNEGDEPAYNIALAFMGGMAFVLVREPEDALVREPEEALAILDGPLVFAKETLGILGRPLLEDLRQDIANVLLKAENAEPLLIALLTVEVDKKSRVSVR